MSNDEWLSATANEAADRAVANKKEIADLKVRLAALEERVRQLEQKRKDG